MFNFLKEKIRNAVSKITKKIETKAKEEVIEKIEKPKKIKKEKVKGEKLVEAKEEKKEVKEENKGIFAKLKEKITTTKIDELQFTDIFWDLELALLENNVAVEVIEKIKSDLKQNLVDKPLKRSEIGTIIKDSLLESINSLFDVGKIDLIKRIKEKKEKPFVIVFVGVNGSGKTTTIAKVASLLQNKKLKCVIAAADTWRAASIQQLEEHGKNLNVKVIKHNYGSDPAAVAFDAIKHAKSANVDVVLVDTAGRQHSNTNLMEEMKKIIKVTNPDLKIFIGEAIVGNDAVNQASEFNEVIGIDGVILTKQDIDEKGGAFISIGYITKKPIIFIGTGQEYKNLEEFDKSKIIKNLELN